MESVALFLVVCKTLVLNGLCVLDYIFLSRETIMLAIEQMLKAEFCISCHNGIPYPTTLK